MKKLKSVCIFLAAATVIILSALLPVLVGMIQDQTTMGSIDYGEINKLHFELRDMTMAEKMLLIYDSATVEINSDSQNSSMVEREEMSSKNSSHENISAIFYKAIQPYIQNGLIRDDHYMDKYEAEHFLAYDTENPNISNIFWLINTISTATDSELNIAIDEQTGTAIAIEYITQQPVYSNKSLEELMWLCYQTYFDSMGVDIETEVYPELVDVDVDTGTQVMHITWQVDNGSSLSLQLSISENGFGIYLTDWYLSDDIINAETEVAHDN